MAHFQIVNWVLSVWNHDLMAHFYLSVERAIRQSKVPPSGGLNEVITGINCSRSRTRYKFRGKIRIPLAKWGHFAWS